MKKQFKTYIIVAILGLIVGHTTVNAYNVLYRYGFSPIPAYISCPSSSSQATLTAVHNSCLTWNGAGCGNLVYRTTATHNTTEYPLINNKNEITKNYRGTQNYIMQTHCYPEISSTIYEADIDINISRPIGNGSSQYDEQSVMTHEIGHLLGLTHVYPGENNVMNGDIQPGVIRRTLTADDRNGIIEIYGGN